MKKILVVDDDVQWTHVLKIRLEQTGLYEVKVESGGAKGLATARAFHPDLILLDLAMPIMGGEAVAAHLKADAQLKGIPIVFLTALVTQDELDTQGGTISGYPFIAKPADIKALLGLVATSIRIRT